MDDNDDYEEYSKPTRKQRNGHDLKDFIVEDDDYPTRKKRKQNGEEEDDEEYQEGEDVVEEDEVVEDDSEDEEAQRKMPSRRSARILNRNESSSEDDAEEQNAQESENQPIEAEEDDWKGEDPEVARKELRSSSDFAQILQFLDLFKTALKLPPYTPDSLEDGFILFSRHNKNELLVKLHCRLLRLISKRGSGPRKDDDWERLLKNRVTREAKLYNTTSFLDHNPLIDTPYYKLPVRLKLSLLRNLCEWSLDYCEPLQAHIKEVAQNEIDGHLREKPLGENAEGYKYWSLDTNELTPRIYKEGPCTWQDDKLIPGTWETVSSTIPEMQQLADSLKSSEDQGERAIGEHILEELLPPLYDRERAIELASRKMARMEQSGLSVRNIVSGARSRRAKKEVSYRYDNEDTWEQ